MKKYLPFLTLAFLISVIALSTYNLSKSQQNQQQEEESTEAASNDFTAEFRPQKIMLPEFSLPDLYDENREFSKKDLIGHYSVVNFFASWCTTCRAEHEVLLRLKSEGFVQVYGVAWRDIDSNTIDYLEKSGNPFMRVASDSRGLFSKIMGLTAVPETVIVDPEGNIVMRYSGNLQEFSIDEIRQYLDKRR